MTHVQGITMRQQDLLGLTTEEWCNRAKELPDAPGCRVIVDVSVGDLLLFGDDFSTMELVQKVTRNENEPRLWHFVTYHLTKHRVDQLTIWIEEGRESGWRKFAE